MESFVLVVDTGSFSAVPRRLNVGQPAVSKMVTQLEERLGVKRDLPRNCGLAWRAVGVPAVPVDKARMRTCVTPEHCA
jgi:hypothetical protein